MRRPSTSWAVVSSASVALLISSACAPLSAVSFPKLGQSDDELLAQASAATDGASPANALVVRTANNTTAPQSAAASGAATRGPRSVPVQRGSIDDVLDLFGQVVGRDEMALKPAATGRVATVSVKQGETVAQGQVLLEADSAYITSQIDEVQARIDTSSAHLTEIRAQADRRAQTDESRKQDAIAQAQASLTRAKADLQQAQSDATAAPPGQQAAEAAVAMAQSVLDRVQEAQSQVASSGPEPAAVRAAQGDVLTSRAKVVTLQAEYDRLTSGPDPDALKAAEREVQKAQYGLDAANATPATDAKSTATRDRAILDARAALDDSQARLAKLRQPPKDSDVQLAKYNLDGAKQALETAQARLTAMQQGPDQTMLDRANKAVDDATTALHAAQARLDDIKTAPRKSSDLRAAQDRVATAQATLDRARADAGFADDNSAVAASDQDAILKSIDQDRVRLDRLHKDLQAAQIRAPAAGTVTRVYVRTGDSLDPARVAIALAAPGEPVVRMPLTDQDAPRLSVGQKATVELDGSSGSPLTGSVIELRKAANGTVQAAVVEVQWGGAPPRLGVNASVGVVVQRKDGVLLIPKKALHTAGQRRYVEYLAGGARKTTDVTVGLTSATDVEITSGLSDGQLVWVP